MSAKFDVAGCDAAVLSRVAGDGSLLPAETGFPPRFAPIAADATKMMCRWSERFLENHIKEKG